MHGHGSLRDEIVEFERLDQVGVPDQRAVGDLDVGHVAPDFLDVLNALFEHFLGAEHRTVALHGLLHREPQLGGRRAAIGVAETVEARDSRLARTLRQLRNGRALAE